MQFEKKTSFSFEFPTQTSATRATGIAQMEMMENGVVTSKFLLERSKRSLGHTKHIFSHHIFVHEIFCGELVSFFEPNRKL